MTSILDRLQSMSAKIENLKNNLDLSKHTEDEKQKMLNLTETLHSTVNKLGDLYDNTSKTVVDKAIKIKNVITE